MYIDYDSVLHLENFLKYSLLKTFFYKSEIGTLEKVAYLTQNMW